MFTDLSLEFFSSSMAQSLTRLGAWLVVHWIICLTLIGPSLLLAFLVTLPGLHLPTSPTPTKQRSGLTTLCFLLLAILCLNSGCARFHSVQIEVKQDGTRIETRQSVMTFWDAQSSVAKIHATTTDKTQGLTVGSISEASESTNAVDLISRVTEAAVRAAISSAK